MNPNIIRVEWHVSPDITFHLRDKLLSKLIDLRNHGHITIWLEHWRDDHGQFRYKYVITPVPPQSVHSANPRSQTEQTVY